MRTSTLTVALVSVLLVAGAGTAGALAATGPLQQQASPTGTTTAGSGTGTPTAGSGAGTPTAGSGAGTTAGAGSASGPGVTFDDQNSSGDSVLVRSATLPEDGFVAIYDSTRSGNDTDQIIGVSYPLNAGTSDNIRIQFDESLNGSKSLTAVIHTDSNGNGEFDYVSSNGQQDPAPPAGEDRYVDIAQVTVPENGASATSGTASGGATDSGGATGTRTSPGAQTASGGESSGDTTASGGGANDSGGDGSGGDGSGSSGPGFGPVAAVVAVLAVALLAARRH